MGDGVRWKAMLVEGIVLVLLGIIIIVLPQFFSFGVEIILGVVLIIAGLVLGYRAFGGTSLPGSLLTALLAVITLIAGILLLIYPSHGLLAITLIVTIFFVVDGLTKLFLAANLRRGRYWILYIVSGLISLALAIAVWMTWPNSSYWLLGILLGINLIFFGSARIALALAMR
jgi:uncharacterized membrane protein HdeD (DUF308 family)